MQRSQTFVDSLRSHLLRLAFGFMLLSSCLALVPKDARARVEYRPVVTELYSKSMDPKNACRFCHPNKIKRFRNEYGKTLAKQLGGLSVSKTNCWSRRRCWPSKRISLNLPPHTRTTCEQMILKRTIKRSKEEGALAVKASFFLWIPEGVAKLRGISMAVETAMRKAA